MQWVIGKCTGCKRDIVRRRQDKWDSGVPLTYVCYCAPKLEVTFRVVDEDGALVVWDEKKVRNRLSRS